MIHLKTGERIRVRLVGHTNWLPGYVQLASKNGRSLSVICDEGVPAPFHLYNMKQCLLVCWDDQKNQFFDAAGDRQVEMQR